MLYVALKMLIADRAKFTGLLFGIAFTSFLATFAVSYFCGFLTRGFALISENSAADVWVMDPAVDSVEQTINIPDSVLARVRSVEGVRYAVPLSLSAAEVRFPNGRFQTIQIIGVDDATLAGSPILQNDIAPTVLHAPDAVIVDAGGTSGKLQTPLHEEDRWPRDGVRLDAPTRELSAGDELLVNDHRVKVMARSETLPRFPPRPLLYTTLSNTARILPAERHSVTFVMVSANTELPPQVLAARIQDRTGLRARSAEDFKADTVRWYLINSEDVGDMIAMLIISLLVGFGVTGVMLYIFTYENLRQYAVLKAMGGTPRILLTMIFAQAGAIALLGTGLGLGLCGVVGEIVTAIGYPFRMMWFTPLLGCAGVLIVSLTAAVISARPVFKLQPVVVFAGR